MNAIIFVMDFENRLSSELFKCDQAISRFSTQINRNQSTKKLSTQFYSEHNDRNTQTH